LILIAGDLFDSDVAANRLRPQLREILSGNPFDILVIPGNHDEHALAGDLYFGDNVEVLINKPFTTRDFADAKIIGIPFFKGKIEDLALELQEETANDKVNILLMHCTLALPFTMLNDFGEEDRTHYLPVSPDILAGLGYDYILAGHFHSRVYEYTLSQNSTFLYSGSPVSITRKEQGKRSIILLDLSEGPKAHVLDTFYYDTISVSFDPFNEEKGIELLKDEVRKHDLKKAELEIHLSGFIKSSEVEFRKAIGRITEGVGNLYHSYKNVSGVLNDNLYRRFADKLVEANLKQDEKRNIEKIVMNIFSDLEMKA
jgi:DNA repair exonuclease SbcCD nuclease subunit